MTQPRPNISGLAFYRRYVLPLPLTMLAVYYTVIALASFANLIGPQFSTEYQPSIASAIVHWSVARVPFSVWSGIAFGFLLASQKHHYRLVDLPWRKWWIWPFIVVGGPLLWLMFLASWLRRARPESNAPPPNDTALEQAVARLRSEGALDRAPVDYAVLREGNPAELRRQLKDRLEAELQTVRAEITGHRALEPNSHKLDPTVLDGLEAHLEELRRKEAQLARRIKHINAEPLAATVPPLIHAEYQQLCAIRSVRAVVVVDGHLEVYVGPVVFKHGTTGYDMGDYHIVLPPFDSVGYKDVMAYQLARTGTQAGLLYGSNFCFGIRRYEIETLLCRREILPAMSLIIEGIHYVNPGDRSRLARRYPEV